METKATPKDLMAPRYKLTFPYPGSDWSVNEIIAFEKDSQGRPVHHHWDRKGRQSFAPFFFDEYPHLFRKLEWHEERKVEDMPEYVKWRDEGPFGPLEIGGSIEKVELVEPAFGSWAIKVPSQINGIRPEYFVPATESEFNSQKQTTNG